MVSVASTARAGEWWSYKIPPLLAVAYAFILLNDLEPARAALLTLAAITSIIAVAAYGYVINDCFDIEVDRLAGKTNRMAALAPWQRGAIILLILAVGWIPAFVVGYSPFACVLLAIDFLLPTIYSIPPIRLKERGVLGVISDASAAHLIPTLFIATVMIPQDAEPFKTTPLFAAAVTIWYSIVGLRGILNHQILDREGDIAAGVSTLVTSMGQLEALHVTRQVLYTAEMLAFAIMITLLAPSTWVLLPIALIYLSFEITKRWLGWEESYVVSRGVDQRLRAYLPLANNVFYNLWFPAILALELALRWPALAMLLFIHLALFGRRFLGEFREPRDIALKLWQKFWLARIRHRFGWRVEGEPEHWPEFRSANPSKGTWIVPKTSTREPSDIKLLATPFPISEGTVYRVTFAARSESPRSVTLGIGQAHEPWQSMGLTETVPLLSEKREYVFDFTATMNDPSASPFLWIGESEVPFELATFRVECVDWPAPWSLMLSGNANAWRTTAADCGAMLRIASIKSDGVPWHVRLCSDALKSERPQNYELKVRASSDRVKPISFGLSLTTPPFEVVGTPQRIQLTPDAANYIAWVRVPECIAAAPFFWLGGDDAPITIHQMECRPIESARSWRLESSETCLAWPVPASSREGACIVIKEGRAQPADVILSAPIPLAKASAVRLVVSVRSQSPPVSVVLQVSRADDPAKPVASGTLTVGDSWGSWTTDLVAGKSTDEFLLSIMMGSIEGEIDVAPLDVWPIPSEESWRLCGPSVALAQASAARGQPLRVQTIETTHEPWEIKLLGAPLALTTQPQKIRVHLRADQPMAAWLGICQLDEDLTPIGLMAEVELSPSWREFHLQAGPRDEKAAVIVWIGGPPAAMEIGEATVHDLPLSAWFVMQSSPPARALLEKPRDHDALGRLAVQSADDHAEDIQITRPLPPMTPGTYLIVEATLRSDAPRTVVLGVNEGIAPWRSIDSPVSLSLTPTWRTYIEEFQFDSSIPAPRLFLWCGDDRAAIEWQSVHTKIAAQGTTHWRLSQPGDARATRILSSDAAASARYEIETPGNDHFDLKAVSPTGPVVAGQWYRALVRVRSETPGPITIGLFQQNEPWQGLGWSQVVSAREQWTEYFHEFQATMSDDAPAIAVAFGQHTLAVELASASLEAIDEDDVTRLMAPQGAVSFISLRESAGIRAELLPTSDIWQIRLARSTAAIVEKVTYRLRAQLRADRARSVIIGASQSESPWTVIFSQETCLDSQWREFAIDFPAHGNASMASTFVCMGGSDIAVELRLITCEQIPASEAWKLDSPPGSAQRLVRETADEPRIELLSPTKLWETKVSRPIPPIRAGQEYRAICRLACQEPRTIVAGVFQNEAPWQSLGGTREIRLNGGTQLVPIDFRCEEDNDNAAILVALGGAPGVLDVGLVRFEALHQTTQLHLSAPEGTAQLFVSADDLDATRLELAATPDPWSVKCSGAPSAFVEGQWYRWMSRLRADGDREVIIGVAQASAPWENVGAVHAAAIGPVWRDLVIDFAATRTSDRAAPFVCVGGSSIAVEVGDLNVREINTEEAWRLDAPNGSAVRLASADDSGTRVEVLRPADEPWQIKLANAPFELKSGWTYRFAARLEANRGRLVEIGVGQAHAPWQGAGFFQKFLMTEGTLDWSASFVAEMDDPAVYLFFWLGRDVGWFEITNLTFFSMPPEQSPREAKVL